MKTGQPILGRPAWYDRNPAQYVEWYEALAGAPHALTKRIDYIVPAGKKAMVECLSCGVTRVTAGTTAGIASATWFLKPSGGSSIKMMFARMRKNAVADQDTVNAGATILLLAGDAIELWTEDSSTGGTVDYDGAYKVTEFDA